MSNLQQEVQDLREQNHELVQAVQRWKMVAGEKEKHILKLTKEANDLRMQISTLRSKGRACARKLETALQVIAKTALSHLVQGSNAVAGMMELVKSYMIERETTAISSHQSLIDSTPNSERVQKVLPLMLGGKSIQPVVSLSRTMLPFNNLSESQGSNENGQVRPLPMRVLQEVYIPLTRIDADMTPPDIDNNHDTSVEDMGLDDEIGELSEEEDEATTPRDERREELTILQEESEESRTPSITDPLEGPSRLLDTSNLNGPINQSMREFTPTMRRRKRLSSPRAVEQSPILLPRHVIPRVPTNGRILKVLVAKMRFDDDNADISPPKKKKMEAGAFEDGETWDEPTSSRVNLVSSWEEPSSSRDKPTSPLQKPDSPHDKTVPPWEKPGSSRDEHVSPWDKLEPSREGSSREKPGPSRDGSSREEPGPSRNKSNSPWDKTGVRRALEKSNSSIENYCIPDVPSQMTSEECEQRNSPHKTLFKSRSKKRIASRDNISSDENSSSSLKLPLKVIRDRRKPKDSPGKSRNDIYRFSIDSQNSEEFDAPSPNGSTNTRVIVHEAQVKIEPETICDSRTINRNNSTDTNSECSDDVPETRTRRARKPVTYKENLKGKLRR